MGYMDDITIGSKKDTVRRDVNTISTDGSSLGMNLNIPKCECIAWLPEPTASFGNFVQLLKNDATPFGGPL